MENKITCPICNADYDFGQDFCETCGWEFKYYLGAISESEKQREQKRIEIEKKKWKMLKGINSEAYSFGEQTHIIESSDLVLEDHIEEQNIIIQDTITEQKEKKYLEAYDISVEKDTFETEDEYKDRINSLSDFKVGTVEILENRYDTMNEKLPVKVNWSLDGKLARLVPYCEEFYLNIPRKEAKAFIEENHSNIVFGKIKIKGISMHLEDLYIKHSNTMYPLKNSDNTLTLIIDDEFFGNVTWSPDSNLVAMDWGFDNSIRIWDINKEHCISKFIFGSRVTSISFSPKNKLVVVGLEDGKLIIWDIYKNMIINEIFGHSDRVNTVQWSPNNEYIAAGSLDGTIEIWDNNLNNCICTFNQIEYEGRFKPSVSTLEWSRDSRFLASGGNSFAVWDMKTKNNIIDEEPIFIEFINEIKWSNNMKKIVVLYMGGLKVFDFKNGMFKKALLKESLDIEARSFRYQLWISKNNRYFIIIREEKNSIKSKDNVEVCDMNTGETVWKRTVNYAQLGPNGKYLAVKERNYLRLWNVEHIMR